jgi:hypothetical protein
MKPEPFINLLQSLVQIVALMKKAVPLRLTKFKRDVLLARGRPPDSQVDGYAVLELCVDCGDAAGVTVWQEHSTAVGVSPETFLLLLLLQFPSATRLTHFLIFSA